MASVLTFDIFAKDHTAGTFDRVGKKADGVGSRFKKLGMAAALAGGVAIAGAAAALVSMTKAAAEDAKGQALLANALKNSAGATKAQVSATEDWISAQGKALGIADDDLRPALGNLVRATGDVGKAQKLASLAMDVSAGSGKSLQSVSTALAKAYSTGNVKALAKFGIATKNADGSTISLAQAQERLSKKFSGAAQTSANTFSGKMQRLQLLFDETKEAIGAKLLPVIERLATWFISIGLPALGRFSAFLQQKLGPAFTAIKAVIANVMNGLRGDVGGNLSSIQSTFQSFVSIVKSLWQVFGGFITTYLIGTFNNLRTVISGALTVISGIFQVFASLLKGDWRGVWEGIKKILSGATTVLKGIVRQFLNIIRLAFSSAWAAVKGIVKGAWDGIKSLVVSGTSKVVGVVRGLGSKISSAARGVFDGVKDAFRGAINWIIRKWNGLGFSLPSVDTHIPGVGKVGGFTIGTPNIPELARGGIVSRPTLAVLGEAGPEAIVPLSAGRSRGGFDNQSQQPVIVQLVLDGRVVQQSLLRLKRNNGNGSLGLA
ncbi:MAG: hypothetical protein NTX33_04805 [Propionibacteriales bacterium]|nr:hypothetical protein [Propionibacteriales bacterium]